MTMTFNKIIYDVREALNQYSDDSEISDRYIEYLYQIKRSKYLRQDLNNLNKTIDNSVQQTYCAELENVNINQCNIDLECDTILRTKRKVPELLDLTTQVAIVNVKPTNRISQPFSFVKKSRIYNVEGSPFPNSIYSFIDTDGYIYIYSQNDSYKNLSCINITGIFENPFDLSEFKDCCNCDKPNKCFDKLTTDFPLQSHYIDLIKNEIVKELAIKEQIPEDKENDDTNLDIRRSK